MDFMNDMVHPEGKFTEQGWPARIEEKQTIENAAHALAAARDADLQVMHVRVGWRPGHPDANRDAPLFAGVAQADALLEGTWGADFHPDLQPNDGEIVIVKRSVSAFAGTELDRLLIRQGISTLVLAGFSTSFVVEGTARDAVDRGYRVIVIEDCCASQTEDMHQFSVQTVLPLLGEVVTADDLIAALSGKPATGVRDSSDNSYFEINAEYAPRPAEPPIAGA
jgi:nicotinamidase-related amidase